MWSNLLEVLKNIFGGRTKRLLDYTQQSMEVVNEALKAQKELINDTREQVTQLRNHNAQQDKRHNDYIKETNEWRIEFIKKYDATKEDLRRANSKIERLEFLRCDNVACEKRQPPIRIDKVNLESND